MKLDNLVAALGVRLEGPKPPYGQRLSGITQDSRQAKQAMLFAALDGTHQDGLRFVGEALQAGVGAILTRADHGLEASPVPLLISANPPRDFARAAALFFAPQPALALAVTGTNGKTSTAHFARHLLTQAGRKALSVGTLGLLPEAAGGRLPPLTTPDPLSLHRSLHQAALQGYDSLVVEASSHGLDQYRLDGLLFRSAAFTNFTQDHLDYHGDMEHYFAAKMRLFTELLNGPAVLPRHNPWAERIARRVTEVVWLGEGERLACQSIRPTRHGQEVVLAVDGTQISAEVPLIAAFQIDNLLTALGLCWAAGALPDNLAELLSSLPSVPGRMELVAARNGKQALVDYAHTPDALAVTLRQLRAHTQGRIICLFGAGGDRDQDKRPLMGQAVAAAADVGILTDDNPRSESPSRIRAAVKAGAPDSREIVPREAAIAAALSEARPGDLVLISGKGHELGQEVMGEIQPFDDRAVTRQLAAELW